MNKKNTKETTKKARVISNATGQCPVFFYEEIQQVIYESIYEGQK